MLENQDLARALLGFVPAASWGVAKTGKGRLDGWEDVGGMEPVVAALRESLELPLRFPHLIAK